MKRFTILISIILSCAIASAQWIKQDQFVGGSGVPDEQDFKEVYFVNENYGWIVSNNDASNDYNSHYGTTDGGNTWVAMDQLTGHKLESVFFTDEDHGWVGGREYDGGSNHSGILCNTSNGGIGSAGIASNGRAGHDGQCTRQRRQRATRHRRASSEKIVPRRKPRGS